MLRELEKRGDHQITQAAINRSLYFREKKPLAVISGAGVAGIATSMHKINKLS